MFEVTIAQGVQFQNRELQKATTQIQVLGNRIRQNYYMVAAIIADIDKSEAYKEDGFNTVHDWVESAFAVKRATSYNLLKLGQDYTRAVKSSTGKVTAYECNLLPETAESTFSPTQVFRMMQLGRDEAGEMCNTGEITPDMTTRQIDKIVKEHMGKITAGDEDKSTDSDESSPAEEPAQKSKPGKLDKVSTDDLVRELNRRGFRVLDDTGKEVILSA